MQIRVSQLVAVAFLVAVVVKSFLGPPFGLTYVAIAASLVYVSLGCLAIASQGRKRIVICCSLLAALSYLGYAFFLPHIVHPELYLPINIYLAMHIPREGEQYVFSGEFMIVWFIIYSFLFALLGAAFGAYWSKSQKDNRDAI